MAVKALLISRNESPWGHDVRALLERYSEMLPATLNHPFNTLLTSDMKI